jgi:hypothetical protein
MKTLASESYNIAWFKLADFVARGEKERALSVLRLLMHSVCNEALTQQLEGDILLAFNDRTAYDRYINAAHLFKKTGNLPHAVGAYQQALWFKDDIQTLSFLLETYAILKHKTGLLDTFTKLAKIMVENQQELELQNILTKICEIIDEPLQALIHTRWCIAIMLYGKPTEQTTHLLKKTTLALHQHCPSKYVTTSDLQKFLLDIKNINENAYKVVETLLKDT